MAYTPINWQTGQTITAEKLNKMDNGWGVDSTQLFSETVTTVDDEGDIFATLQYAEYINYDTITVVFNGQGYECANIGVDGTSYYGGLSEYPFGLQSDPAGVNTILTETAGTYTVAASVKSVETSIDFGKARGYWMDKSEDTVFNGSLTTTDGNNRQATITETPGFADAATLNVTLDGVEYNLTGFDDDGYWTWGAPYNDFSEYSFSIYIDNGSGSAIFLTQVAGTYTLKIEAATTTIETSSDFDAAVNSVVDGNLLPFLCVDGSTSSQDANTAMSNGRLLYFWTQNYGCFFINEVGLQCTIAPTNNNVTAGFNRDTGVFFVEES